MYSYTVLLYYCYRYCSIQKNVIVLKAKNGLSKKESALNHLENTWKFSRMHYDSTTKGQKTEQKHRGMAKHLGRCCCVADASTKCLNRDRQIQAHTEKEMESEREKERGSKEEEWVINLIGDDFTRTTVKQPNLPNP